jgi:hypothetical protein
MRKSEALYYPNLEPPIRWLRSAALLFDTVRSIVPSDTESRLSSELLEFAEATEAWIPFRPTGDTGLLVDVPDHEMDEAFRAIAEERKDPRKLEFTISNEGSVQVTDHVFTHGSKLSNRVRERLEAHGLMLPQEFNEGDWWIVNEKASDLVLSYIADRIAARQGWMSLTDRELFYVFNVLGYSKSSDLPEDQLARLMVTELVPEVIDRLPIEKYSELRKRYEPIRQRLSHFLNELVVKNQLGRIADGAELEQAVQECVKDLKQEIVTFRESAFGKFFREWGPFSIGSLITLGSRAAHLGTRWSIALGGASLLLSLVDKTGVLQNKAMKQDEMVRLLAAARNDIIGSLDIKRYLIP